MPVQDSWAAILVKERPRAGQICPRPWLPQCSWSHFKPRSHGGSGFPHSATPRQRTAFQSALPRRERHMQPSLHLNYVIISIHAPMKRATWEQAAGTTHQLFQPPLPREAQQTYCPAYRSRSALRSALPIAGGAGTLLLFSVLTMPPHGAFIARHVPCSSLPVRFFEPGHRVFRRGAHGPTPSRLIKKGGGRAAPGRCISSSPRPRAAKQPRAPAGKGHRRLFCVRLFIPPAQAGRNPPPCGDRPR